MIELHTQGAKLAVVDEKGWTPLHYAARHGQDDIVKYIAHKGKNHFAVSWCSVVVNLFQDLVSPKENRSNCFVAVL